MHLLFGLVPVTKATADNIYKALLALMFDNGFNNDIMSALVQWIHIPFSSLEARYRVSLN